MGTSNSFHDALEYLNARILATDPSDPETVAHLGECLSEIVQAMEPASPATKALTLGLTSLQDIERHDASTVLDAVATAVAAASEHLSGNSDPQALDALEVASAAIRELLNLEQEDVASQTRASSSPETRPDPDAPAATPIFETPVISADSEAAPTYDAWAAPASPCIAEATPVPEASVAGVEPELQGVLSASDVPASTMFETLTPGWEKELLPDFLVEARDHIATAEAAILLLEVNPDDMQSIHTVLRAFHTIKGSAGLVRLSQIQALAHQTESLLIQARDGKVQMARKNIGLTLQACDAIKLMLDQVETTPATEIATTTDSVRKLQAALSEAGGPGAPAPAAVPPTPPTAAAKVVPAAAPKDNSSAMRTAPPPAKPAVPDTTPAPSPAIAPSQAAPKKAEEPELATAGSKPIEHESPEAAKAAAIPQSPFPMAPVGDVTIRVDTGRLDELVNSVGELVIAHSILAQNVSGVDGDHGQLLRNVAHSGKIIRQLQDLALSLRMVPFKGTFHKMSRLVRDLSLKSGKSVYLHLSGEETEIDRNMVQALNDPLMHMIRNAVDHGIESAEERVRTGKGPVSELHLRAYHAGGNVVVELEDDGKGLDRERIIRKATEHGLVEAGRELSDDEAYALIFHPGLSTAEQVTDVSGRGVGLDVVRRNIESLRGHIGVATRSGHGTTFTLRVPLTLAILDAMLVRVGRQQYLLPTVAIQRSFRPQPGSVSRAAGRAEMVMFHDELYPLFRLHKLFNVEGAVADPERAMLLLIEGANKRCALLVDEIVGQQQAVIKSLGNALSDVQGVVGGAILGNGRVGIILDVVGLVQLAYGQTHGTTSPGS